MLELLKKITTGKATMEDLKRLEELAGLTSTMSLCGLGKGSANPVYSTLRYFREEYLEHIVERRCRAGICRGMVTYTIDPATCVGCRACARACPVPCIEGRRREPHEIVGELCVKCGRCFEVCRFGAVIKR